jgi:hypothetical protein
VVLEAAKAIAPTLHLLGTQVERLGRAVAGADAMVSQDLAAPRTEMRPRELISSTSSSGQPAIALSKSTAASLWSSLRLDVAHRLLDQTCA